MAGKRLRCPSDGGETFERGLTSECLPSVIVDPQHVAQDGRILDALVTAGLVGSRGPPFAEGGGAPQRSKTERRVRLRQDDFDRGALRLSAGHKRHVFSSCVR